MSCLLHSCFSSVALYHFLDALDSSNLFLSSNTLHKHISCSSYYHHFAFVIDCCSSYAVHALNILEVVPLFIFHFDESAFFILGSFFQVVVLSRLRCGNSPN
eukprot:94690_1